MTILYIIVGFNLVLIIVVGMFLSNLNSNVNYLIDLALKVIDILENYRSKIDEFSTIKEHFTVSLEAIREMEEFLENANKS